MGNLMGSGGGKAAASSASKAATGGVHSTVFFDVSVGQAKTSRIVMNLHGSTPKTSENFRALCTGEKGMGQSGVPLHYKGSRFHRVIPGFMAQGGDFTHGTGIGGESIYGAKFPDENFTEQHTKRGILSMANAGPNTNGSQFFICFDATPHLNGAHVVFGEVVEGLETLDAMEAAGSRSGQTSKMITIEDCGQLDDSETTSKV